MDIHDNAVSQKDPLLNETLPQLYIKLFGYIQ